MIGIGIVIEIGGEVGYIVEVEVEVEIIGKGIGSVLFYLCLKERNGIVFLVLLVRINDGERMRG